MNKKVLHIISQAHLDPVWLWPLRDGITEALMTIQSAVDRCNEFADFRYTRSSIAVYRWLKESDPRLFKQVQDLVAQKRWEIAGGWEVQTDCNLPSLESFMQQASSARQFVNENFGESAQTKVAYVPDSFGHCGGLPQILCKSGFEAYAFMRPNSLTPLLFNWFSPDGSKVLGIRIPIQYSQSYSASADDIEKLIRNAESENFSPGFDHGIMWLGIGNHGGGPAKKHLQRIIDLRQDKSLPELRFSTLSDFVKNIKASESYSKLPDWHGELGHTFRGCYAATAEVKKGNRYGEKGLYSAEAIAAISNNETAELPKAWRLLMFNQFHDILAGTCTVDTQEENRHRYGEVLNRVAESKIKSLASISRNINTQGEKTVVLAANPLPWTRKGIVSFDTFMKPHEIELITHIENQDGSVKYPIQWLNAESNFGPWGLEWAKLCAIVDVPACGYQMYRVATKALSDVVYDEISDAGEQFNKDRKAQETRKPIVKHTGQPLNSIKNSNGVELLNGMVSTVVLSDPSGPWGHNVEKYNQEISRPELFEAEVIEDGPIVIKIRHKFFWGKSTIWMDTVKYSHSENVLLHFRINWQEERKLLKLEIPLNMQNADCVAKMPGEVCQRPANGEEYPCHEWLTVS